METPGKRKSKEFYSETMKKIANSQPVNREEIMKNLNEDSTKRCWEVFCGFISKNYQFGRGTIIPSFGTFTFTNTEVNLEGTTNQFIRDKKQRKPVFIVSSDFVETLKPGIVTENGIIHYQQKLINSVSHVKINYAELSISANLNKAEFVTIIDHLLRFIADNIRNNSFRNKDLPGLGALILKNNVLAVKFNELFSQKVKSQPQKLIETKKNVCLYMNINTDQGNYQTENTIKNSSLAKSLINIRPKTTIVTKVSQNGEKWLRDNLDIEIDKILLTEEKKKSFDTTKFFNDMKGTKSRTKKNLLDLEFSFSTLESIYFNKGVLLSEMKLKDIKNRRTLKSHEIVEVFLKVKLSNELSSVRVKEIIEIYYHNSDLIDYFELIDHIIKDIKNILNFNEQESNIRTVKTESVLRPVSAVLPSLNKLISEGRKLKVELPEIYKEVRAIKTIISKLKDKYSTRLEQNISYSEFSNIMRDFNIVYPDEKIVKILAFIELNPNLFSLKDFILNLDKCKIISNEILQEDIQIALNKIKNIIYSTGKCATELFINSNEMSKENFTKLIKSSSQDNFLTNLIIDNVFFQITKMDRNMKIEEFQKAFYKTPSDDFEVNSINKINENIKKKAFNSDEYFDHLVSLKNFRVEGKISRFDFHKALQKENYNLTAQELDFLFNILDSKKDGFIDREEWNAKIKSTACPLFKIQDLIRKNNLEIEDILFRIQIDIKRNELLTFYPFKAKMLLLDNQLDHNFINSLFLKIKNGKDTVDTKTLIHHFNIFKKESFRDLNSDSFKRNFIEQIKSINTNELRLSFEKLDSLNCGLLEKVDFCRVLQRFTSEYKDEDIMRFIRITSLFEGHQKVKYQEFIDLIFYNNQANYFNRVITVLQEELLKCQNNLSSLMKVITGKSSNPVKVIEINEMLSFLRIYINDLTRNTICKLDLDQDGKISFDDLKGILERHLKTSFFKYENNDEKLEVKVNPGEVLENEKFKVIVKDIKMALKNQNLTDVGLFKRIDSNNNGFITNPEFNKTIDSIIKIAPSIKDQFFNTLDVRKLGMVDIETFLAVFKEFSTTEKLYENSWDVENRVLIEFKQWILNNQSLNENEIFTAIDYDFDGTISNQDFKKFLIQKLKFIKNDINDFQIDRALQMVSMSKNKFLGLNDIKNVINQAKNNSNDLFGNKLTTTITNFPHDKRYNWIDTAIEKLGIYVSDKFTDIQSFFKKFSSEEDKMTFQDFSNFVASNTKCFDGLNLTKDEYLTLFSAMDPHKKSFLRLQDFKNKLDFYNFYEKMDREIKTFLKDSFITNSKAFRYFIDQQQGNLKSVSNSMTINSKMRKSLGNFKETIMNTRTYLTKKEFFDGIIVLFPKKYSTNQILRYMKSKFKNEERIEFLEFSYVYFDLIHSNDTFQKQINFDANPRAMSSKVKLSTPFDLDPLEKLRRLMKSSKFEPYEMMKIYDNVSEGKMNDNEFRNMLKKLNLGLTSLEIDQILKMMGRTQDGKIDIKEFIKYSSNSDENIKQIEQNVKSTLSMIKQLIYKYYTNPKICFQFNDRQNKHQMDFETYKSLICNMYKSETKEVPNFNMLKNTYDQIDIRRDGIIDFNEWLKTFNYTESLLDKKTQSDGIAKELRQWETSKDISAIYQIICKNRKQIKESTKDYSFKNNILNDNLIKILKDMFPEVKISNTQWKMIVSIGDKEKTGQVNLDLFFSLINNSSKNSLSHPKMI